MQMISSICVNCSDGYFIGSTGLCTQVDPYCKSYNKTNGACLSCYDGFTLTGTKCLLSVVVNIPYCTSRSSSNGACLECMDGYYLSNNSCKSVSITCGTYNKQNGQCTSCISGYFFQNNDCILPAFGIDQACTYYTNGYCTQCARGYYLSNFMCVEVNRFCTDFNYNTNTCNNCFNKTPVGAECL